MLEYLYFIFILPVENIVEFIFYFMNKIFADKPVISIVFVSLAINLMVLPLYKRADDMQERERAKVKSMERWNKHIRKTFKGDERYMIQTAYYRIEGYKPIYAITGSMSLVFQIPFFIAAYHFLSNLSLLKGVSFFLIPDLGAPDGIIKIGALSINFLPVLMTMINIVSGFIYTKGFPLKDKIQLYVMALFFLVLLYDSPSGLVLYWTCNNLFSLLKNLFFKIKKNRRLVINIVSAFTGTAIFATLVLKHRLYVRRQFFVFGLLMLCSYIPAFLSIAGKLLAKYKEKLEQKFFAKETDPKNVSALFWLGAVLNTVILGLMIPSELISSSPTEFGTIVHTGPLELVASALAIYAGVFLVWIGIFFAISTDKLKKVFACAMWVVAVCSLVNYYFFYGKFGIMNHALVFNEAPVYNDKGKLINLAVLIPIALLLVFVIKKWPKIVKSALSALILMFVVLSSISVVGINRTLIDEGYYQAMKDKTIEPTVSLSKNGNNVMVFMLDRAISEFVPYIFKELPDVAEDFEDFVYYPNTISFGGCTNFAAPAVYGGYEYTPTEMNKRTEEKLVDKHNEALMAIPVLFGENGYDVSVVDPPYANYKTLPDPSIFDGYENVSGYTTFGRYSGYNYHTDEELLSQRKHVAIYSLFRTAPVLLQNSIYDEGNYLSKPITNAGEEGFFYCAEAYVTMDNLDTYMYVDSSVENKLVVMTNQLTHEPTWLETPNYTLGPDIDYAYLTPEKRAEYVVNGEQLFLNEENAIITYHVDAAALRLLGEFFDYLRKEGVYDNTRIIIVSDHGWPVYQMNDVELDENTSIETFNPILLVKDFKGSDALKQGELRYLEESNLWVDDTFMTNADVATLCVTGTIENPVNPFTGKEINNDEKTLHTQMITSSQISGIADNNGNVYRTDDFPWLEFLGGEVKDKDNWFIHYED